MKQVLTIVITALVISLTFIQSNSTQASTHQQIDLTIGLLKAKHSQKCLDESTNTNANGANIHQWNCHSGDNQIWHLEYVETVNGKPYYQIKAQHSGKCVDVKDASRNNGANIHQWTCEQVDNQLWTRHWPDHNSNYFELRAKHSGQCLDVSEASNDNGANVHQWDCVGGANQLWLHTEP